MELNQTIQNFTVIARQPVAELEATLWQMEHKKSGARLVWLDRKEENKTFSIAFQTQPWDDTGVFHILEHSVLCGSDKFPVKEPFVELLKSSLNTFLNAMTFPDKTMYPFSTRNDQDFLNLLRVYMDAVLHPLIHSKPEIFGQEGWHYELSEAGEPSYKGVVFNEMKGAFASPDSVMVYEMLRGLFPDTCYRFESGGHPEHIPELSYEDFAAAHKRLYHPANSYIFLDGSIDLEQVLGIIDREYLCEYDRIPAPGDIPIQHPVNGGTIEAVYELSSQEELQGRARLANGFVACVYNDRETIAALEALSDVLAGDNQAPLKRCLLEKGLAKDVHLDLMTDPQQPIIILEARDIDESRFEQVSGTIYGELERLCREGLDHKRICATLDNLEFHARQRDYGTMPQGLVFAMQVMDTWLYGGDPGANLSVGRLYEDLRGKCGEGFFEELIRRILLDNPHRCRVHMRPSHTIGKERQEAEAARLNDAKSSWSVEEEEAVRRHQANIEAWQASPDTPEALATIPMLRLDQIPLEPEELPLELAEASGLQILAHRQPTGGITYLNLYFAIDDLNSEQLIKATFMTRLLGSLETDRHDFEALQREMRSLFGQISFTVEPYSAKGQLEDCRTFICASCSMLDSKLHEALELFAEILTGTRLEDPKRVYELICQQRAAMAEQIVMSGNAAAQFRVMARTSAEGVVMEHTGGIEYLRWLKELEGNFQERFSGGLAGELTALAKSIFTSSRLTLSFTGSQPEKAAGIAGYLAGKLPEGAFAMPDGCQMKPWPRASEGIIIPADVSFAAMGGAFPAAPSGQAKVMARVASLSYLWNAVRVQGGAYGVGTILRDNGFGGFYSFRDPSAARTLGCYVDTANFLRGIGDMDLTGMIISAVAQADPLLTPRMRGKVSDARHWRQMSLEEMRACRQEMLSAKPADLIALADQVQQLAEQGSICVLGSQKQIEACKLESVSTL